MDQDPIVALPHSSWYGATSHPLCVKAVEAGQVLYFPDLAFELFPGEEDALTPSLLAEGKRNISLDLHGEMKGAATGDTGGTMYARTLLMRFAEHARSLVTGLFPMYEGFLRPAPTSLRPAEVETRKQSVRADDRRMHIDAFPTRPTYGERILRVFSNINPDGKPRVWRVGEPFEDVAKRYLPAVKPYSPWQAAVLKSLGVTKSLRSEYDHLMLQLHDRMKEDERYQAESPQVTFGFPPGTTWICFSDQTVHAAMAGQHMLEQTFHLSVARQHDAAASPLATLTRLVGRPLQGAPLPGAKA